MEMGKLDGLKEELKKLNEDITLKEMQVEKFIKDLLGGNMYECERKLKEAEALVDKLENKILELNNG